MEASVTLLQLTKLSDSAGTQKIHTPEALLNYKWIYKEKRRKS